MELSPAEKVFFNSMSGSARVTAGIADTPLLPSAPRRVAVLISAPLTNRITLGFGEAAVLDEGITLYPLGQPLTLTLKDHGDLVRQEIRIISFTAPQVVKVHFVMSGHG